MTSPCMDRESKKCTKNFQKLSMEKPIIIHQNILLIKEGMMGKRLFLMKRYTDNRFLVPYNPHLLLKYNCHINVEVCSTVQCVKYLFNYCYKGHYWAMIKMTDIDDSVNNDGDNENFDYDEIKQFLNTR